jgi:hypothetical protein
MIYEAQQFASSLALNQLQLPKVFVDPDVKWITVGKERMDLDKLRSGVQDLLKDLEFRYLELTKDNKVLKKMPDHVVDDLTDTRRGYSFLSEEPFHGKRNSLFLFLVKEYKLAVLDHTGRIGWNIPEVKDFLRRSSLVWEPLYHLLYLTSHISCRGSQFVEYRISNADRHRNLFMQGSEMFVVTGYSKTTGITNRDSCTPGFLPKQVTRWVLEMLGGGLRNAESILAGIAYGEDAEHLYRT